MCPGLGDPGDTIVAVSSAIGRGALGIVRLSGPDSVGIARRLLSPYPEEARHATLATARDPGKRSSPRSANRSAL